MASRGHEYTLVGFSEEVDRRPLTFVEALPATKICSACGSVPKVIALHPCEHFFCKPCYEQCQRSGEVVCPFDGEACLEEEVSWINHPTRSVMARKVLCWNQSNGCNVVTAAGDVSKHFHHECVHHLARCPKCTTGIPARDVCAHLESRCEATRVLSAAAVQTSEAVSQEQEPLSGTGSELSNGFQGIYNAISMAMSTIQADLKEISHALKIAVAATTSRHGETGEGSLQAGLLQESLSQVRIQTAKLKEQLDEFTHNVNSNQQTFHNRVVEKFEEIKQSITDAAQSRIDQGELAVQLASFRAATEDRYRETKAEFERLSLAINRQYDLINERLPNANASGIQETRTRNSQGTAEAHTEYLAQNASGIAWAKSTEAKDRQFALAFLPSIMPGAATHTWTIEDCWSLKRRLDLDDCDDRLVEPVYLRGYRVSVGIALDYIGRLNVRFQLHKGIIDQYLEWPFNLDIKFSILHPQGTEKLERRVTPSTFSWFKERVSRPNEVNSGWIAECTFFKINQMQSFEKDGRLLLRLELEPTADDQP